MAKLGAYKVTGAIEVIAAEETPHDVVGWSDAPESKKYGFDERLGPKDTEGGKT